MATVDTFIAAAPSQVFAVLSDGWRYSNWVVGTSHIRAVETEWPAVGSRVYHASGIWPVVVRDSSVVEEVEPDRRLVLTARGWPLGQARVVLELSAEKDGTRVSMREWPTAGPAKRLHNAATQAVLDRRNVESLARLAAVVERPSTPRD